TWRSPGMPVIRAVFTQPVSESSVRDHLFIDLPNDRGNRIPLEVAPDPEARDTPRVWLLSPMRELPLDARARLMIEPGLKPAVGTELGDEARSVVEFATFPEFRFIGVVCATNAGEQIVINAGSAASPGACNPLGRVGLSFSAPVIGSEIKNHVQILPDLAGGRTDYDPWANWRDYSRLDSPHEGGRSYTVWLPERLEAAEPYRIRTAAVADGPKDEFGRALAAPIDLGFQTSHRPPDYTLVHPTAVLEQDVDSQVPLYVTNLDSVTVRYHTLTAAGSETGLSRTTDLPAVEDIQYGVPLGVREMLGGASGAVYGRLSTEPSLPKTAWEGRLFAEVTPYQVHVKLGHFNTLVWVMELATGQPVRNAAVSIYVDRISSLAANVEPLARATTDASGVALLAGTRELDPRLDLLGYNCPGVRDRDNCPRLFVRVDSKGGFALIPLGYEFEVNSYRASNYTVWPQGLPEFGHLHAWGTTAQGVYRAGDTIQFKIFVRDQDNESYVVAPQGPYRLDIVDPTGQVVHTVADVMLSEFGGYSGSYAIPQTAAVGWYQFTLSGKLASEAEPLVRYPLRVLVSDFTPSPFGVTTSLNGDLFEAGDAVVATTRATLFSGGPYVDAEARVTAQINSKWFQSEHPLAASFRFDSAGQTGSIVISQFVDRVGAQGELVHAFRIPPDVGNQIVYGSLSIEGAVRDDRGKYVASASSADFVAVDRLVGLKSTRWVFRQNEPAEIQYIVVDGRGAPAAGTDVHVDVERLETKAARVKGAGNAYLTEFIEDWIAAGACDGRSTATPQSCNFVPDAPGSYRLTATIQDTLGRAHKTILNTWVVGAGQIVWRDGNDDALEIVPEKTEYNIGDTARYLLKNPYPGARALVTIERYGTLKQWVQTLEGSTPVIEFAVDKDFMPGFYLSVLVMSPRVDTPPPELGELDLGKPAFKLGYVAVPVADPYKQIEVTVATQEQIYKPGDTVRARIKASPRERERREPIEVAVVVLDEAVLDLIQGGTTYFDPYEGFYTLDGLDVRNYSLLTRLVGRQKIELKGANPGGDGGAAFSMRSLFKYVSYWNPSIRLDNRGNGAFEFQVPDNLTGWRVLVLATTPTDRMGLGQDSFKVNLPTEVRPVMPNQVTEGDRFEAAFSVMNRTDSPRDIRVAIAAAGGVSAPVTHEETVHLDAYQRTTVRMPVAASRVALDRNVAAGRIDFTVTAQDAIDGDGLNHALVVNKRRVLETAASYGSFDDASITERLSFPARIHPDVGDVGVVLAPSVIGSVDGAFRYMRDYPYTCWEQQLTKGVMASHFVNLRAYLPADLQWPESAALPAQTLAQAASFQAPNGGMTYYVPQDTYVSPYLSAYTALAFNWLREDGHAIPESVEAKLHEYLDAFLKRDVAPDFYTRGMASTVRAVALAALAKHGKITLADLSRYREHVQYMSLFGKAHYLQAALAVEGGAPIAREVERIIL
ncbi:MAG TPA: MG2 domain-containing protein, partial [Gammaproteobacteria bacterium]|nr:MG2 domain-containing protein [Gammaproteobacteria bacterium]